MNESQWREVRAVFDQVVDAPPGERDRLLASLTAGDEEVRAEVEALLGALETGDERIERERTAFGRRLTAPAADDPLDRAGTGIGPYRLIRRVGRGGMGDVFLAERVDGHFDRRVAIKLIRPGMNSEAVIGRFRQERQILARLSHPAIAPLLDGGVTPEGLPYLVMEYLEGRPITVSCAERGLSVDERLALFRQVCGAVHFAHQNLVIHRDLKPGNIIVMPDGSVRLLDFGVAKLLHASGSDAQTMLEGRGFTPSYASPEQIRGDPVTTATDVYSLGVVLYELLTGRLPYELDAASLGELLRAVETLEPTRPSRALPEDSTRPTGTSLRRKLQGDLDNIVLMAIEKDPARRYASVHDFSEDLRRYLEGHPVVARADTFRYRAGKFLRRNRRPVAAAATIAALLIAGVAGTLSQSQRASIEEARAEQRAQDLRELTTTLLFDIHDAVADLPGATGARELILERGFATLERLSAEMGRDEGLRWEVAEGFLRLGMVQGQPAGASLGDLGGAQRSYERAIEISEQLVESRPDDMRFRRTLALSREKLGDVLAWSGSVAQGADHARAALDLYASIADAMPDSARHRMSLAISLVKLGDLTGHPVFPNLNRPEESLQHYNTARTVLETPPLSGSSEWGVRRYRALVDERIGMMHRIAGRWAEARTAFAASLEERVRLAGANPANADARRDVAIARQNLCEVERAGGDFGRALPLCRDALAIYQELHTADEKNTQAATDIALGSLSLAGVQAEAGDTVDALSTLERAVTVLRESVATEPTNVANRRFLGRALGRHTLLARQSGRAAPYAGQAVEVLAALVRDDAAEAEDRELLDELEPGGGSRS